MILLPAIYLGLIGLVIFALYLHATVGLIVFQNVRQMKAALLIYVGPLVAGGIVVAFMLKPLFARPARRPDGRKIDPSKEPLIAAFVDGVCSSVGAPTPSRIEVDCRVNASAHLASWALSPSKELVLTIGLPLVAGLTLKQFTGVLAHEFGHFSQGAGMRLSILIRSINHWFARVVYERDEWDETLESWSSGGNIWVMLVVGVARISVWLTRRVLWLLMQAAHLVSGFLSRQMEFDADRYEARMVGSTTFAETMGRIAELSVASNAAHAELEASWRERRLPDDLPRLISLEASKIPESFRDALAEAMRSRRTGLFDTHPSDKDRIARASIEGSEGIFSLGGPATDLFRDFDALSRATTYLYYRSMLGGEVSREQLYPISDAVLDQEVRREGYEAFGRFFLGGLDPLQALPLSPKYPEILLDPKSAKRELVEARKAMEKAQIRDDSSGSFADLHDRAVRAEAAVLLLKAGKSIPAAGFGLSKATVPAAELARDAVATELRERSETLEPFGQAAARRLMSALALLEIEAVAARVPDGPARRDEARALYPCASALGSRIVPELGPVARATHATNLVVQKFHEGKGQKDESLVNALLRAARSLHEALTELKWKIGDSIDYPFEHAQEGVTLGRFALPAVPDQGEIGDLLQAGSEVQDRLLTLHYRILGRLAVTAEAVEHALGLPPLAPISKD
ncbi:M48 family metalloprotease [Tundrisphaera lichenicola]|uniref:M48 family metallopeptidase n=1 Tax=Tundrisphaera lichenicola TaxID=2029860 RepID=UPI003EBCF4EF